MDMNLDVIQALLRGISTACLLLLFIRSVYQYRALAAGLWFAMLCLGLMAYVLLPLLFEIAWLYYPAVVLALLVPPVFWLFCDALFNEQMHRRRFPVAAGLAIAFLYWFRWAVSWSSNVTAPVSRGICCSLHPMRCALAFWRWRYSC